MPVSTDPGHWFLGTRDNADTKVSLYTSGNKVEPLVDGADYMKKLHDLLIGTGPGDYVFLAGWHVRPDLRLSGAKTVADILREAAGRKVAVRLLLSCHEPGWNWDICSALVEIPGLLTILDSRFDFPGSAHQKIVSISTGGALHAFCGGIDLTYDRGDDSTHSMNPEQRQSVDYPGGWHDVHAYVQGPAARDIDETFRERWRNKRRPNYVQYTPPISITNWPIDGLSTPATPNVGNHHVQVLRTYACDNDYPFAKKGEFTARAAVLRAIQLATDYVYIEDQYFFSTEVAAAIIAVLKARPQVRVIVVVPREPTKDMLPRAENYYQGRTIARIKKSIAGTVADGNFSIYELRNVAKATPDSDQVYVHAKLMIVDDVWVEIGSMNCNIRSMTHDLEAAVAIVDGEKKSTNRGDVCKFARDLRLKLWAEHLDLTVTDSIDDPVAGYDVWKVRAGKLPNVRATPHQASANQDSFVGDDLWLRYADPSGRCPGARAIPAP